MNGYVDQDDDHCGDVNNGLPYHLILSDSLASLRFRFRTKVDVNV